MIPIMPTTNDEVRGMRCVTDLLIRLERGRFYGSLELKLEAGQIVLIKKTETLKPSCERRDNRGTEDDHRS
jgi:hypothetical protein